MMIITPSVFIRKYGALSLRYCEAHEAGNRLKQSYILKCLKSYLLKKEKFFIPVIAKHTKKETG